MLRGISIPFTSREKCPSPDCDGTVDKASKQRGIPTVIGSGAVIGANEKKKLFSCFFGKLELNVLLLTGCT